jgi:hypothetical protein
VTGTHNCKLAACRIVTISMERASLWHAVSCRTTHIVSRRIARGVFTSVQDLAPQADALHSGLLKDGSSLRMEIFRCSAPHQTLLNERCPHAF